MTPEMIAGLIELVKVGGVGGLSVGGVIYLIAMRRQAPEKTPLDHVRDDLMTEITEVRADLAMFRLEVHGRLTAVETELRGHVK